MLFEKMDCHPNFSLNIELLSGHRGGFEDRRGGYDDGKQTSFSAFW